ncbi:Imm1 family immunity protein [Actinokineospora cianjurensis]|uniref:Immunity protein Imm1 of predicted polymorphic toxin system n=1 Tax=Actinokineospora cianjurensis TaxID=585224 RepID=A0A421B718_9PSEU|nr:Imm1 family immunity protein [Actinokineospora cianjurensis]RLK60075.1 immunity protein Imm1 of predicted polymorphic toxin system [Actinokineospora cianjurensis]
MTDDIPPITHLGFISMDTIPTGTDLVKEVRALNAAGVEIPWMWVLTEERMDFSDEAQPALAFGVHNEVGAVQWQIGGETFLPVGGANPEWVAYWLAGFHESYMRPHTEVTVETALSAVAEFLETRRRPTCVEWRRGESLVEALEGAD